MNDARSVRKLIRNESRALYNLKLDIVKFFSERYPNIEFRLIKRYVGDLPLNTVAIRLKGHPKTNDWLLLINK